MVEVITSKKVFLEIKGAVAAENQFDRVKTKIQSARKEARAQRRQTLVGDHLNFSLEPIIIDEENNI